MVVQDGPSEWYAQGLDIDLIAQGDTKEAAQHAFERGLMLTVHEHLNLHGNLGLLLTVAPQEAWSEFYEIAEDLCFSYSQITMHSIDGPAQPHMEAATDDEAPPTPKVAPRKKRKSLPFNRFAFASASASP